MLIEAVLLSIWIEGEGYVLKAIECPDVCTPVEWKLCDDAMVALLAIDLDVSCHAGFAPQRPMRRPDKF